MRINNIKINGFSKIKNKQIEFSDGINIVYGENEAGKSTILKFISAMFFGASKNKNGKNVSDFDRYKPWDDNEFSGKIKYTLEDDESYEIFREFKKKNPVIYNGFGEDISKKFDINKTKGISFFEQQTGIDEQTFWNTTAIEQQEVKLKKLETNNIVQKMSNLVSTGDDNISFKKSMDKLNKMQNECVGTDRTKQKPINIVINNIDRLLEEKKKINLEIENSSTNYDEKKKLNQRLQEEQCKKEFLKETKKCLEETKVSNARIDLERDLQNEYFYRVNVIREKINAENESKDSLKSNHKDIFYRVLLFAFIVMAIVIFILLKNIVVSSIAIVVIAIMLRKKNMQKSQINQSNLELKKEYEIAVEAYERKKKEIDSSEKKLQSEIRKMQKDISDKYRKMLNITYIEEKLQLDNNQIETEIELTQNNINEINVQTRIVESKKENIDEKLERLTRIQEDLEEQRAIQKELTSLDTSFNIAKQCLEKAYDEIKHNISPKFQQKLYEIISDITDGKYTNINVNDENGLYIEVENGAYMPIDFLSVGTIDEMYLSLRLSTLSEISKENLPIILDETFAYFDENRLRNIMRYLQDKHYDNQIIIFTCTNREKDALNDLKIEYNLIDLEK